VVATVDNTALDRALDEQRHAAHVCLLASFPRNRAAVLPLSVETSGRSMESLEILARSIRERRAVLFVGAGVSMGVGLPSWEDLTKHMVDELELDGDLLGDTPYDYQTLAEYYRLIRGDLRALNHWIEEHWKVSRERLAGSLVHSLIVSMDFPVIFTTNYDRNLETAFQSCGRPFVKLATARDIANATVGLTQIVKFHGDFDDEASLVLTETDYFERLRFESPLDVKFHADALSNSVLFIGYSMSDLNIRLLLHRMWQTWRRTGYEKDRPPSFVFMHRPTPIQEAVLRQWGITVLTEEEADPGKALEIFLGKLKSAVDKF
jgi:hypothetical protein